VKKYSPIVINITPALHATVKAAAKRAGISVSEFVRIILKRAVRP
jgi:predicted HicB family RNase H-like nuclease